MSTLPDSARFSIAPGSVVIVRDEEWLVTGVEQTTDGRLLRCQGLSELVRDTTASFYEGLDADLHVLDPAEATVVADDSPHYRRSRLWLEAALRKTAVPLDGTALTGSFLPFRVRRPDGTWSGHLSLVTAFGDGMRYIGKLTEQQAIKRIVNGLGEVSRRPRVRQG